MCFDSNQKVKVTHVQASTSMSAYHDNTAIHPLSINNAGHITLYALPLRAVRLIAFFLNSYDRDSLSATATHFQTAVRLQSENTTEKYKRLAALFTTPVIALSPGMDLFFTMTPSLIAFLDELFKETSLLSLLAPELMMNIMDHMDWRSIVRMRGVSKELLAMVSSYVSAATSAVISSFNLTPKTIMTLLFETKAVISGSSVLLVFFPRLFKPGDIDFYVPVHMGEYFMTRLSNFSDYCRVLSCSRGYDSIGCIQSVYTMISNSTGKKINVIVSGVASAVRPILEFHSTAVMNVISGMVYFQIWYF